MSERREQRAAEQLQRVADRWEVAHKGAQATPRNSGVWEQAGRIDGQPSTGDADTAVTLCVPLQMTTGKADAATRYEHGTEGLQGLQTLGADVAKPTPYWKRSPWWFWT